MNKELKRKLQQSSINSKWCNMGTWQKEDINTLWGFVEDNNIKIKKTGKEHSTISFAFGTMAIKLKCPNYDVEKALSDLFVLTKVYLGDRARINTIRR